MKGLLTLANGTVFTGQWEGGHESVEGETVFFTGMTGYEEVLSDPSYKGQIVVFSYPLIGNYGISEENMESKKIQPAGVIVAEGYSGYINDGKTPFLSYLNKAEVPVMTGVDTRTLIQSIRTEGSMKAVMHKQSSSPVQTSNTVPFKVKQAASSTFSASGKGNFHVVLIDFGYKKSILQSLVDHQCKVTVVPYDTPFHQIEKLQPDGLLFSNGPGDPKELISWFPVYKKLAERYPCFGICLGHQILALAFGGNTKKLKFGHRGANHPVMNMKTGKVSMSSQNHSYVVEKDSLIETGFDVLFRNVNDDSVEGLTHRNLPVFSVQFHPEAAPGPREHQQLFEQFITSIQNSKKKVKQYA
ncbi:carbamoyl phosphate synthase small subunit [Fictibacillus aquaticus]|uniref:Carbamoyl phosphate synthase small chain n=1 Tax=Fictibacillus aquaticus TaxID=2021314 RepID=A0A235F5G7_9BACL|nr:carbamoyl phosphate synthase small subunit [Fictibacillus aquaticus]OYD56343.1 carbamoyl phosphate synthase small subunit [Fictibacillus aquaticus]